MSKKQGDIIRCIVMAIMLYNGKWLLTVDYIFKRETINGNRDTETSIKFLESVRVSQCWVHSAERNGQTGWEAVMPKEYLDICKYTFPRDIYKNAFSRDSCKKLFSKDIFKKAFSSDICWNSFSRTFARTRSQGTFARRLFQRNFFFKKYRKRLTYN